MAINRPERMVIKAENGTNVTVRLEVNDRARRLILRLDERQREAVAVAPTKRKLSEAAQFALERVDWLADRLAELPESVSLQPGSSFPFRGAPCRISLDGPGRRAQFDADAAGQAVLYVPGDAETAPRRVTRFLRNEARADLKQAVAHHTERLGVKAAAISVKDTRSRWGSCTSDGRLSFSWRLILAPPPVLDYVAAHECAHLIEMKHSPAFWAKVAQTCPDWKRQRHWLRTHGRALHAVGSEGV